MQSEADWSKQALVLGAVVVALTFAVGWTLLATVWAMPDAEWPFLPEAVARSLQNLLFD